MSNDKQKRGDIAYVIFDMDGLLSEPELDQVDPARR